MPTFRNYAGELPTRLQDYRSKGQREAGKNRPPADAAAPDQHESALQAEGEGWLSNEQHLFDTTLNEVARSVTQARQRVIELGTQFQQLLGDEAAASAVSAELANDRAALVQATETRLRYEADLRSHRATNEIHEEPSYPDSWLWHAGVILMLGLLEVVVNAFFYENSNGLLGGFFVALGIAVVNMGSAFGLGYAFRYKNLRSAEKRVWGWLAVIGFVLFMVFCNALFAAFRSEYQLIIDPSDPTQTAQAFARAWPEATLIFRANMEFKDPSSFILFGIGIVLSVLAFWKGYTLDDKYPGHGPKDRKYRRALADEQAHQEAVRQRVREFLHRKKAAVQAAIHEPTTQIGMLARRVADLEHARGLLETQIAAVRRDHALVTNAYRHANAAVRSVPPPAYFGEPPALKTEVSGAGAQSVLTDLEAVQRELKRLGDDYREPLNARLRALQDDTTDILSRMMAVFQADVLHEAEGRIARATHTNQRLQAA